MNEGVKGTQKLHSLRQNTLKRKINAYERKVRPENLKSEKKKKRDGIINGISKENRKKQKKIILLCKLEKKNVGKKSGN